MSNLKLGIVHKVEIVVEKKHLASSLGSGGIDVFATPMMITLMEGASLDLVQPLLEDGQTTVGTLVDVKHIAATPLGMKVYAESELIEIDRKRLVFKVTAYDEREKIGEGIHERFIIDSQKFLEKTGQK
ncbi:MAG: hypothetical protein CSB19_02120 [Clostridiales bacterium]|nr:MAG: hypothetical protein CSB19_02120 [Clostridiales bacterium]